MRQMQDGVPKLSACKWAYIFCTADTCKSKFASLHEVPAHVYVHHSGERIEYELIACPECGETYRSRQAAVEHFLKSTEIH